MSIAQSSVVEKKSDAYQSGFLEGTTPTYEAYMQLKKSITASLK